MPYGLTATSKLASDKQLGFIKNLVGERKSDDVPGDVQETIMNVLEDKIVTSSEASDAIGALLSCPKAIKGDAVIKTSPTGGLLADIPLSNYAVEIPGEGLVFLRVAEFKGTVYLRQLIGAPGTFKKIKPVGARRAQLANAIKTVGVKAAAKAYADHYSVCAVCNSELTDALSRELGLGSVCRNKF